MVYWVHDNQNSINEFIVQLNICRPSVPLKSLKFIRKNGKSRFVIKPRVRIRIIPTNAWCFTYYK